MSDEKPLHVRTAEALGWTECRVADYPRPTGVPDTHWPTWHGRPSEGHWPLWMSRAEWEREPNSRPEVPHYELSWEETGPLIEKFGISLNNYSHAPTNGTTAHRSIEDRIYDATGTTPLLAVCALILKLKEAGKL